MSTGSPSAVHEALREYFEAQVGGDPLDVARAKVEWRMSCFHSGLTYANYLEKHFFPLAGRTVLDPACAWGGHAVAFATRGAQVAAAEFIDHEFAGLRRFCEGLRLEVRLCRSNCEQLPFTSGTFDVILAFELIEHINSVDRFAGEVARLLCPGGICLISTPARVRSLIEREPHYGLKGLTWLPLRLQSWVARKIFGRRYPYPIVRQYSRASQIIGAFSAHGLVGQPVLSGRLSNRHAAESVVRQIVEEWLWNFVVIRRPNRLQAG